MKHLITMAMTAALAAAAALQPPAAHAQAASDLEAALERVGQPAPISAAEYAQRRRALAGQLGDGVFVAFGAPAPAADYLPYAQDASFRYLTGITEPSAGLVMVKEGDSVEELLFVQSRDPAREVWEGRRLGPEGATARTGVAAAETARMLPTLDSLLARHQTLYTLVPAPPTEPPLGRTASPAQQLLGQLVRAHPRTRVQEVRTMVERLRATKSPAELDLIRRAVLITTLAHRAAMRATRPGMNEFETKAVVEYFFTRYGAEGPAYASIVGSGPNSTTLHYREADRFMRDDDVLLIDAGALYRGYAADVTRTFPVDGVFTPEQRAIYRIVLDALLAAEAELMAGRGWPDMNRAAERVLAAGLAELGLIDSPAATYQCASPRFGEVCPQYRLFYMHGLGHGVGLNVHDPDISMVAGFRPGSAVTIEPGIYVRGDALDHLPDTPENRAMAGRLRAAVERYRDIGVRIEDVYLTTADGVERVSAGVPREIDEIEALMREPGMADDRRPEIVEWYRATEPRAAGTR